MPRFHVGAGVEFGQEEPVLRSSQRDWHEQ